MANAKVFKPVDLSKYGLEKRKLDLKFLFRKEIEEYKPDCLAISVLSAEFLVASEITRLAKE